MRKARLSGEDIYESLLDDNSFSELPARLAAAFDARSTVIHWHYSDGSADILSHSGYFSDEQLARYASEFAAMDPWAAAAARGQQPNMALDLEDLVSQQEYERSTFYNEYLRPMGDDTARCMGIRVQNGWGAGMLAIQRGRMQQRFDDEAIAELNALAIHIRRTIAVRGKFASLDRRVGSLQAMLDCFAQAALLVRLDGSVLHSNRAAEALLRQGKFLRMSRGKLDAAVASSSAPLKRAIHCACNGAAEGGAIKLEQAGERPLIATVMPSGSSPPQALILVQDGTERDEQVGGPLRSLYGLTGAEAEIAVALSRGISLAEIAERRGVAVSTVRAQLKALSQKLECRRQSEIVSIVKGVIPFGSGSAAPVGEV